MSEEAAAKQMATLAEMLALCLRHQPDRVASVRQEFQRAYQEWQSVVQEKEQGR